MFTHRVAASLAWLPPLLVAEFHNRFSVSVTGLLILTDSSMAWRCDSAPCFRRKPFAASANQLGIAGPAARPPKVCLPANKRPGSSLKVPFPSAFPGLAALSDAAGIRTIPLRRLRRSIRVLLIHRIALSRRSTLRFFAPRPGPSCTPTSVAGRHSPRVIPVLFLSRQGPLPVSEIHAAWSGGLPDDTLGIASFLFQDRGHPCSRCGKHFCLHRQPRLPIPASIRSWVCSNLEVIRPFHRRRTNSESAVPSAY